MKKLWNYKISGIREPMISVDYHLKESALFFVLSYSKGSFYESRFIKIDLETQESQTIFTTGTVVRSVGVPASGKFYFNTFKGIMYCMDEDGCIQWETAFGKGNPDWHVLMDGDKLYGYNQNIYCFDKASGEILWQDDRKGSHASCDILIKDNLLYHAQSGKGVYAMDKATGQVEWTFGENLYVKSCTFMDDVLLACAVNGSIYVLESKSGKLLDEIKTGGSLYREPVISQGCIYIGNDEGSMFCFDKKWQPIYEYKAEGKISSQALIDGEKLWFAAEDNYMYCIDRETGTQLQKKKTQGVARCLIKYQDKLVVLSDKGQVECYMI